MSIVARYALPAGCSGLLPRAGEATIEVDAAGRAYLLMGGARVVKADSLEALLVTLQARASDLSRL